MFSFFGFKIPFKFIIGTIVILGAVTWGWIAFVKFKNDQQRIGYEAALNHVAKQNAIAAKTALKVKLNVEQCFDDGGDWDITTGKCIEPDGDENAE